MGAGSCPHRRHAAPMRLLCLLLTTSAGASVSNIRRSGKERVLRKVLTREVVADLARLSESAVMYDLPGDVWTDARTTKASEALSRPLMSRERSVFFAPTAVDGYRERARRNARSCEVPAVGALRVSW